MLRVLPVTLEDLSEVAAFVARVIRTSVDASDEERAGFIENALSNLRNVAAHPGDSVHLKCLDSESLVVGYIPGKT